MSHNTGDNGFYESQSVVINNIFCLIEATFLSLIEHFRVMLQQWYGFMVLFMLNGIVIFLYLISLKRLQKPKTKDEKLERDFIVQQLLASVLEPIC